MSCPQGRLVEHPCSWPGSSHRAFPATLLGLSCLRDQEGGMGWLDCLGTLQPTVACIQGKMVSEGSHVRCTAGGAAGKREGPS